MGLLEATFGNWKIGHVYKVATRHTPPDYYYCTVIKNTLKGQEIYTNGVTPPIYFSTAELLTYIPNGLSRSLDGYCELDRRLKYMGPYKDYGHLLFNQKNLVDSQKGFNEHQTKFTYKTFDHTKVLDLENVKRITKECQNNKIKILWT